MGPIRFAHCSGALFFDDEDVLHELARYTAEKLKQQERDRVNEEASTHIRRWLSGVSAWRYGSPLYAGTWDDEDLYDYDTDTYKPGKLKVECPTCHRTIAPLLAQSRVPVTGGWEWVGLDHQQPFTEWWAVCGWCATPLLFKTVTPQ